MSWREFALLCLAALSAIPATAQTAPPAETNETAPAAQAPLLGLFKRSSQWRLEQVSANHLHFTGQVDIEGDGIRFFADTVDLYTDSNTLVATGNVVFANAEGRISAERVEFDTSTGTGTFHQASGVMALGAQKQKSPGPFGAQEADVYFYGEQLEKLGPQKYRVVNGGFTTCVQPTPRWEVTSGSVVLNLNQYAVSRNTVMRVKGVPLFYLPVLYYPLQDDDRATGFLLPTYGTSTLRGQAISNAFFWAISRNQDATFGHDLFTKTGQGAGGEYRYVLGPQSSGTFRVYRFARRETTFNSAVLPAANSLEINGTSTQTIGPTLRTRVRLDYFTDVLTQQLYHQNVYQATRRSRVLEAGVTKAVGPLATSLLYQRNETFNDATRSVVYGSTPRATANLAPQQLFSLPVYGSVTTEFAHLPYENRTSGAVTLDNGLSRVDLAPTLRAPLSRLSFLSINSSAAYRTTYYSRSADSRGTLVDTPFTRQYLQLRTDLIGPVLTRIWDLPKDAFAERLKHVIEPAFVVDYTTSMSRYRSAPVLTDASDFVVGGATRFTYGLTNRLFYRGRTVEGVRGQTREFVTVGLQQSYYSKPEASQYDTAYASAYRGRSPVDLSPVAMNVRVSPSNAVDTNARVEYDVSGGGLQVFTAGGNLNLRGTTAGASYSRRHLNLATKPDDYLSGSTTLRSASGHVTGNYSLSWDIARGYVVSQHVMLAYMAQCCGLQMEFQKFNYPKSTGFPIPSDRRFNFAFVLAGLGTFSNFYGALAQR